MRQTTSSSHVLHEENGIRYSVATPDHGNAIVRILSESFQHEPMSDAIGASANDLAPLVERFMLECTNNGLSVVAAPVDEPDTVAGVLICRDFKAPLPEGIPQDFRWFLPIAQALMTVDEAYETKRRDLSIGEVVDLWMAGVDAARFAKRGIATTLFQVSSELGRDRGFKRAVAECTGHYSQSAARRTGFKEMARLAYSDFRFSGTSVFAGIGPPHTHLILYERTF